MRYMTFVCACLCVFVCKEVLVHCVYYLYYFWSEWHCTWQ